MSYVLKRTSTVPASALRVLIDDPPADGKEAGLAAGGSFHFEPAGQEGDTAQVSEYGARSVMGDPGLAKHFTCIPELPSAEGKPDSAGGAKGSAKAAPKGVGAGAE